MEESFPEIKSVYAGAAVSFLLFVPLFLTRGIGAFDFWWWMALNGVLISAWSFAAYAGYFKDLKSDIQEALYAKLVLGIFSALVLYVIFAVGNKLSPFIVPQAQSDIASVYGLKEGVSLFRVILLITFIIGPAEEIFWRGFVQKGLRKIHGETGAVLISSAFYTLVHVGSINPMLLIAAFVCGVFWGELFEHNRSVFLNVVSHVIWDLMVFVVFPFS